MYIRTWKCEQMSRRKGKRREKDEMIKGTLTKRAFLPVVLKGFPNMIKGSLL